MLNQLTIPKTPDSAVLWKALRQDRDRRPQLSPLKSANEAAFGVLLLFQAVRTLMRQLVIPLGSKVTRNFYFAVTITVQMGTKFASSIAYPSYRVDLRQLRTSIPIMLMVNIDMMVITDYLGRPDLQQNRNF